MEFNKLSLISLIQTNNNRPTKMKIQTKQDIEKQVKKKENKLNIKWNCYVEMPDKCMVIL